MECQALLSAFVSFVLFPGDWDWMAAREHKGKNGARLALLPGFVCFVLLRGKPLLRRIPAGIIT